MHALTDNSPHSALTGNLGNCIFGHAEPSEFRQRGPQRSARPKRRRPNTVLLGATTAITVATLINAKIEFFIVFLGSTWIYFASRLYPFP